MKVTLRTQDVDPRLIADLCAHFKVDKSKVLKSSTFTVETDKLPLELAQRVNPALDDSVEKNEAFNRAASERAQEMGRVETMLRDLESQGLIRCEENQQALATYLEEHGLELSRSNVAAFLRDMGPNLLWRSTRPAAPPPQKRKPEVLGICSDGRSQLPLSSTKAMLAHPSTSLAQVKDWRERAKAAGL
jgi:hypothetical protein